MSASCSADASNERQTFMNLRSAFSATGIALFLAATAPGVGAQQDGEQLTVAFSDPSRQGLVNIEVMSGRITVKGGNRKDVLIIARQRGSSPPRESGSQGGLRRLTQAGGFTVEEERNVMQIESHNNRTLDFEVHVPARTDLQLKALNNSVITVENVEGDIEAENLNGSILMTGVAGTVVANSNNGRVQVTMTRVTAQKAMAFTSLNGTVDVTLPAATRATLKLRSDMGDVFTDFDVQLTPNPAPRVRDTRRDGGGGFKIEVDKSVQGTINGGGPEIELRTFNSNVYLRKGQ